MWLCIVGLMPTLDPNALAEKAVRLGLLTPEHVQEGRTEVGHNGEAAHLLQALERKGYLTPWQTQKLLKNDSDGYFLGGYRILYKVASGSFGRVYRGDDPNSGRIVAIKVLRSRHADDKERIELFEREGKIGMTFQHPNIVEVLAVNRDPATKQHYIVMEFVEGGTLRELLAIRKKLDVKETLRIIEDAASGLAYAFARGVTHRDIKLTNVLISSQGQAKLVDFGLAGAYGQFKNQDQTEVDRTCDYAGLERNTNAPEGDTRSDIYFLGCIAYELLTGRPPLAVTKDAKERMSKERYVGVVPMKREEVNAPPSVFKLVETMMALNPQFRYQTPAQLLDALRQCRRELDSPVVDGKPVKTSRTIFITEGDERLQDVLREKFKEQGFRVLMAKDPVRALERFRTQPFDLLVVNGATTGDDGILIFERIMNEAIRDQSPCKGILMLDDDQRGWEKKIASNDAIAIMVHPVKLKQLQKQVAELLEKQ